MPSDTNSPNKEYKSVSPNDGYQMSDNEPSDGPIQLKKQLGLMNGVGIIVGVIIGSGIFISPKGVLLNAGSVGLSMIVWLSCGLLVMCGALCYAELGTAIPKSGGEFAYLKESFGPLSAFLYLWVTFLIIYPTGNAIIALTFAEYILSPLYSGCKAPELAVQLLAAAVTGTSLFLHIYIYIISYNYCINNPFLIIIKLN